MDAEVQSYQSLHFHWRMVHVLTMSAHSDRLCQAPKPCRGQCRDVCWWFRPGAFQKLQADKTKTSYELKTLRANGKPGTINGAPSGPLVSLQVSMLHASGQTRPVVRTSPTSQSPSLASACGLLRPQNGVAMFSIISSVEALDSRLL